MKKSSPSFSSLIYSILFLSVFGLLIAQPAPVHAAAITVDTFDDDVVNNGNCTLREAVEAANSDTAVDDCAAGSGADTITLSPGVYALTEVDNVIDGNNGLPAIVSEITIEGFGAIIERVDPEYDEEFRFFHVAAGASLTLDNVTLENGYVDYSTGFSGGAIYNLGTLHIENGSQLTNNQAPDGYGGAIYNESASATTIVTDEDTRITNNYAFKGAALYNNYGGFVEINNGATIDGNEALFGGGIFNDDSTLIVDNATIGGEYPSNWANEAGGIYNQDEAITIIRNNAQIIGNNAIWRGGGLVNRSSTMTIESGTIVADNVVLGLGYDEDDGALTPQTTSNFYSGELDGFGGGFHNNSELNISEATIRNNSAPAGGGLYNETIHSSVTIERTTIHNNTAVVGGGLYTEDGSDDISNSTLSGNEAADDGGAIFADDSNTSLNFVTLSDNVADADSDYYGVAGGIYGSYSSIEITNSIVAGNHINNDEPFGVDCFDEGSSFTAVEHTLVGDNSSCEAIEDGVDGNIVGDFDTPVNPALTELSNFGGPTLTHNLIPGSAAIDAASSSCVPTDQRGFSRPVDGNNSGSSECDMGAVETEFLNDAWPRAKRIDLTEDLEGLATGQVDTDSVDILGQSRWYKFSVDPESDITVDLTDLAANYDITLYKDIAQEYAELVAINDQGDLVELTAEFAPDAYSPDIFSPDIFSPDIFSPDIFSPDIFSPDIFSPDIFSPDIFSPDIFSPDIFSPDIFSPDIFSPDIYSPDIFSPDIFSPDIFSPDPTIYSSAQLRSLIGVSALESTASESISVRSWSNSGDFYIRVRGRYGAFVPNEDFTLDVAVQEGGCADFVPSTVPFDTVASAGSYKTIILTDISRMSGTATEKANLEAAIANFATRADVAGVVVELDQDQRIVDANLLADDAFDCPHAKNVLADDIKTIIDDFWAINPLEYVVIIGNDNVIPFYRHPDQALLANESNYVPPVADATASQASLKLGYVLGQDRYGSEVELSLRSDTLTLPELAVGRLVETPTDVMNMIAAYEATNGLMATPQSSFVTGYDFLEDAAEVVQAELELGIGNPANTLITPQEVSPMDTDNPLLWDADDLRNEFLTTRHDVVYLAGHFSSFSALAADYQSRMFASEVANSAVDLTNILVFSTGCHSGYNTVNEHGIPNITVEPDWAQAFAQKGSTLIAGTGYQYGDTDFVEYNERLYRDFALQLRAGSGPVAIGQALVEAKNVYLANTPALRPLHEKSLLEVTLYGLPMMRIDMPEGRNPDLSDPSIVSSTDPFTTNPGLTLGLEYADMNIPFSLSQENTILTDATDENNTFIATHFVGSDGTLSNTSEPALPLEMNNVGVSGTVLRGVGYRGGSYTDLAGLLPLTGAATTELRSVHAPFLAEAFFPVKPYSLNYINALMDPDSGDTGLMITPAQFQSDGPLSTTGVWRRYDDMEFRFYYSSNIDTFGDNVPALANPPSIVSISALSSGGNAEFKVVVQGDPSASIQEVWVTYTSSDGSFNGEWQSIDLVQDLSDSLLWTATLPLAGNTPANMRYIVQAVNGVGGVSLAANGGFYYTPDDDPDPTQTPTGDETTLTFISAPASGDFGDEIDVTAELTSLGNPVAGKIVRISLGGQTRLALTGVDGRASVSMPLLSTPGDSDIIATFSGDSDFLPSFAESPILVAKQATIISIALEPDPAIVLEGDDSGIVATLTDSLDRRLREKSVFFIVSGVGGEVALSVITNYVGEAPLGIVDLPVGVYTVDIYFNGAIPLPSGVLTLDDVRYLPSSASTTLEIVLVSEEPTCDPNAPGVNVIYGTEYDDTIFGTNGDDVIFGLGGNDRIFGRNGNDCIAGGEGDDQINGGNHDDLLLGNSGNDSIIGRNGNDTIYGGADNDFIDGNNHDDTLFGGAGDDIVLGGNGVDIIEGGPDNDTLGGQNGDDDIFGGAGDDELKGNNGDDYLNGGDDTDICIGGSGFDTTDQCEAIVLNASQLQLWWSNIPFFN